MGRFEFVSKVWLAGMARGEGSKQGGEIFGSGRCLELLLHNKGMHPCMGLGGMKGAHRVARCHAADVTRRNNGSFLHW